MLLNNAATFQAGYFEEISDAAMRAEVETNLFGPMNVTRAVLPVMREQGSGHVMTITSLAGILGGGIGGQLLGGLLGLPTGGGGGALDIGSILGQVATGGAGGGALMVVVGIIKSLLARR